MTSTPPNLAALVDDMLQDAGCGQDAALRNALLSLGTLASLPVPEPTGELAALLEGGASPAKMPDSGDPAEALPHDQPHDPAVDRPDDELARRRGRHRPTALGLVLVAGMGLGVGGVAATSTAPESSAMEHLLEDWAPWTVPAAKAAGPGYRAPAAASGEDLTDAASTGVSSAAADTANPTSRLLRDSAGKSGRAALPPCAGPVKRDAGNVPATCGAGAASAAADGNGSGSRDSVRPPAAQGTPAGNGTPGAGKPDPPASNPPGGPGATGTAARKTDGSAGTTEPAPGQGQSSGDGQGNGQKGSSPAK